MKPVHETDHGSANDVTTELNRLFEEAIRCLEDTDLPGANEALKKAHAEVVSAGDVATGARRADNRYEDRG